MLEISPDYPDLNLAITFFIILAKAPSVIYLVLVVSSASSAKLKN